MNSRQTRTTAALRRSEEFVITHTARLGGIATTPGRQLLSAALETVSGVGTTQGAANLTMLGQVGSEKALSTKLRNQWLTPLSIVARARLRGVPDIAALTQAAPKLNGMPLVRAARAMARAAAPHLPALVAAGFSEHTLQDLETAAGELENAIAARAATRSSRIEATGRIEAALNEGREGVAMLHALIIQQFSGDTAFLAAWNSARRVYLRSGSVRERGDVAMSIVGNASAAA